MHRRKRTKPQLIIAEKRLICLSVLIFMLLFSGTSDTIAETYDDTLGNVLVLHSYDYGLSWTNEQNEGIISTFRDSGDRYNIYVEYMDRRKYPDDKNLTLLKELLYHKYSGRKIDLIITTDDAALKFALYNRAAMFSDAPIVFSGINEDEAEEITRGYSGVTGVIEEIDPVGTLKAAFMINPDIRKVYVICDNSENGIRKGEATAQAIRSFSQDIELTLLNSNDTDMLCDMVSQAESDSIVICTAFFGGDIRDIPGFDYICSVLSQKSSVPVYHLYDIGLGNGAIGGSVAVGKLQGEEAAKIALMILKGGDISDMQFVRQKTNKYIFDYNILKRFKISLNKLPPESEIINKPYSFLDENRGIVITALVVFVMLLIFITVLLFYLKRLQAMKKELSENNAKLTGLYEDLSTASRKLKKQYDELVSVQNDLSSSEYKLGLFFEKMMNGFFIFEPVFNNHQKLVDIRFIDANPGFFHNIGIPRQEVRGKTWLEVFGTPNTDLAYYQNLIDTGKSERFEAYDHKKDTYYMIEPFLITENQIGVMFENITGYKKALKEVKKLNADLEKRVADRTARLQEAVNDLESFAYTVSHDLKSPLRAVDGYVSILLEDFGEKLDSDAAEMLSNISRISRESIDMINKILQYSKTSRAVMNLEQVDMGSLITEVYEELKPAYSGRDISLVIESGLPCVRADRILMRQLLQNIISNSMKFTAGREKAIITVGCTITQDSYVFYIKDNGVGFDMNYSGKLFGLFQRLHTSDEFEGSGIGLVTVKKIVQKHGGKVWIEGKVDEGTTVFFSLPVKPVL